MSRTRRLHAVAPLEEKPYQTCNIVLVKAKEEDSRSESTASQQQDLLDVEPPDYEVVTHPELQQ